jgi:hypothetical protein
MNQAQAKESKPMKALSLLVVLFLVVPVLYAGNPPLPKPKPDYPANYKLKQPVTGAFGLTLGEVFGTVDADGKWMSPESASNIDKSNIVILKQIVCDYQPAKRDLLHPDHKHPYSYKVAIDSTTYKIIRIEAVSQKVEFTQGLSKEDAQKEFFAMLLAAQPETDRLLKQLTKAYGEPSKSLKPENFNMPAKYRNGWIWIWCETDKDGKGVGNSIRIYHNGGINGVILTAPWVRPKD